MSEELPQNDLFGQPPVPRRPRRRITAPAAVAVPEIVAVIPASLPHAPAPVVAPPPLVEIARPPMALDDMLEFLAQAEDDDLAEIVRASMRLLARRIERGVDDEGGPAAVLTRALTLVLSELPGLGIGGDGDGEVVVPIARGRGRSR